MIKSKGSLRITGKRKRIIRYHRMVYAYPKGVIDLIEELTVILQHCTMSVEESKSFYNLAEGIVVALRGLLPSRKNATFSINDLSGLSSRGCSTIRSRQIGQLRRPALMRQSSQNECMHPVRLTNF